MPPDDVILAKVDIIERCLRRIRDRAKGDRRAPGGLRAPVQGCAFVLQRAEKKMVKGEE